MSDGNKCTEKVNKYEIFAKWFLSMIGAGSLDDNGQIAETSGDRAPRQLRYYARANRPCPAAASIRVHQQ